MNKLFLKNNCFGNKGGKTFQKEQEKSKDYIIYFLKILPILARD